MTNKAALQITGALNNSGANENFGDEKADPRKIPE
jgi:hypothetical protein